MQVYHLCIFILHVQVKSYAKLDGKPNKNDRGYVSIGFNVYVKGLHKEATYAQFFRLTLLCTFIFLNILTPVALAKSLSLYSSTIRNRIATSTGDFIRCLYWATAIAAFFCNTLYIAASLKHQFSRGCPAITSCIIHLDNYNCSIPSDTNIYRDEVLTLVGKLTIIPSAIITELVLSIYAVRSYSPAQSGQGYDSHNFSWNRCLLQTVHVLALWNIQVALQLFTMVVIPVCVLLLIHPQETICASLLFVIVPVVLTLTVAYTLCQCQQSRWKQICCNPIHCVETFMNFVLISAVLALIIAIVALYETILLVQAEIGTGVQGLVFSLLPLLPLSAIGWYLKRRCQRILEFDYMEQTADGQA